MGDVLDVLVVENRPGVAADAVAALGRAGHRVHRCHDDDDRGFPCRGVVEPDTCPLVGAVDVTLVVRRGVTPRPTGLEHGVSCSLRSRVPVVEDGPTALDPFDGWLAGRVRTGQPVVDAVEVVARESALGR